jgi:Delta3-Delta2-enoyl-CoA isomerase
METILIDYCDHAAIVKLNHGITNNLGLQLVRELAEVLQSVKADPDTRSLILGSANNKFFSIGFDIPNLYKLSRVDFTAFYQAFNQACLELYTLPKPTVAAITGHATAGGCILALCCDYRYIAEGRKFMGLNEIKLGVPVPYLADCVLRQIIGVRNARDVMESGEFYLPEELRRMGMVDQVLPLNEVLPESIKKARSLGASPREAFAMIKCNRVESVVAQIQAHSAEKEQHFIMCWYSEEARERLKAAMDKF